MADQCFIRILVTYQTHVYTFGSLPTINKWKGDWCFKKKCQLFLVTWIKEAFTINIWVIYIVFTASFETLYTIYFGLAYRVIKFKRTSNLEQRLLISFLRVCNLKTCTEIEKRHWHDVWKRCMLLICSQRMELRLSCTNPSISCFVAFVQLLSRDSRTIFERILLAQKQHMLHVDAIQKKRPYLDKHDGTFNTI